MNRIGTPTGSRIRTLTLFALTVCAAAGAPVAVSAQSELHVLEQRPAVPGAEDFSYYAQETPGLFIWLGIVPEGTDPANAPATHPLFFADEGSLPIGVRALAHLTVDYLTSRGS